MPNDTIIKTIFINASREIVWEFLTDKDKLGQWFHPGHTDLAPGIEYKLGKDKATIWGSVLTFTPPSLLKYTFIIPPLGDSDTTVTFELESMGDGTKLTLTHEGIAAAVGDSAFGLLSALDKGWDEHFASLRRESAPD